MKRDLIIVNDFFDDPYEIRRYAMSLPYYSPYSSGALEAAAWISSHFKRVENCPFKSDNKLIATFERLTGEELDREHWNLGLPLNPDQTLPENYATTNRSCRWNCCFHMKPLRDGIGLGVHNHVTDPWNGVGEDGWVGLIYLHPTPAARSGLSIWKNKFGNDYEWMTNSSRWQVIDAFSNVFNRLILHRGSLPHASGPGFGTDLESGRLFQTFFFKVKAVDQASSYKFPKNEQNLI